MAYSSGVILRSEQGDLEPAQLQQVHFKIGHDLLMAASCANTAASRVTVAERRT
ncbi:hypothetical protein ABBQ38_011364 [Trebouxia sp. C0009 RCD-2024]